MKGNEENKFTDSEIMAIVFNMEIKFLEPDENEDKKL